MSDVKKAALEYATERVPESAKFKEQIIVGNHLREEIHDSFIRGFEFSNKWYSFKEHRPPYYKTCLVKVHEKTEPIAAWLASTGDSDIWTICSTDVILPPVKLWRPVF